MRPYLRVTLGSAILALELVLSSCGDGSGGGTGPGQQSDETLASFDLTVPDSVTEGEVFSLNIRAVGNQGTIPLPTYSGAVSLSTTLGTVTPSSVSLSAGTGSAQVTLSAPGQQTLTASGGGRTGSVGVNVTDLLDPPIVGNPDASLEQGISDSVYVADPADYSDDHPQLPGMYLSHKVVLMAFAVGTTVQQANDLLEPLGGQLAGGISGVPGQVPSIVIVKLATTNHAEMETALATLRADPIVLYAVQDGVLSGDALPEYTGWTTPDWSWEWVQPTGGNWGMELIRVPQMWNLNRTLDKQPPTVWTGVIDAGFDVAHDDLRNHPQINFNPGIVDSHGTHVAGTIGADFWDGEGIEGVNPFTGFAFAAPVFPGTGTPLDKRASWGAIFTSALIQVADPVHWVVVINMSLAYNWYQAGIDFNTSVAAQDIARNHGALFKMALDGLETTRPLPVVAVAAGNDSGSGMGLQDAKYASPMCNAALEQGADNIIVVENVRYDGSSPGEATRSPSSNLGGHISAPGTDIFSTVPGNSYGLKTGTSMATPHVAGLIGYMLAVEPTLSVPQIRAALLDTSIPVGGLASNRIDAWAAVMQIDQVQGDDRVLRRMLDIDDGTLDGNQRVDYDDNPDFGDYEEDDADGNGGIGDGDIDMSDFRVWRDWYLRIWEPGEENLDGSEDHLKMDVNGNNKVEDDAGESHYPRGDFNGDGILSLEDSVWVLGAVQDSLSDLDVLKMVFDDLDYDAADLDDLVLSSDIEVDATEAFARLTQSTVLMSLIPQVGPAAVETRLIVPTDDPRQVFTVPHEEYGYIIHVEAGGLTFNHGGVGLARGLGSDVMVRPIDFIPLDPKATFYHTCGDQGADAVPISLAELGIEPGDLILLERQGQVNMGQGYGDKTAAVFSSSSTLLSPTEAHRVPGALNAGDDYSSPQTYHCGGEPTDIPEDFAMNKGLTDDDDYTIVQVPEGAWYLFLAKTDSQYSDNGLALGGDPYGVAISIVYVPGAERTCLEGTVCG